MFSSSSWTKIIKYSWTEKSSKIQYKPINRKVEYERNFDKCMLWILINSLYQQRWSKILFALPTADLTRNTRQRRHGDKVGWDKYCTTLPVLVLRWKTNVYKLKSFIFSGCGTPVIHLFQNLIEEQVIDKSPGRRLSLSQLSSPSWFQH